MKWIDLPPIWLLGAVVLSFWVGQLAPLGLQNVGVQLSAGLLIGAGLVLMGLAIIEMRRHKTTVIPHLEADHLVRSGIFARSRNPIYLGDVLLLAGFMLRWDALLALPLVPALIWVLRARFILPEEDRLAAKFGAAFADYTAQTRRWL